MMQHSLAPEDGLRYRDHQVRNISEAQLILRAKRGDSEAFEALSQIHTTRLLGTALHITRNREDAEDALQDSLMRAFMHVKNFHGKSSFSTWLTRIVINSSLMIRRKRRGSKQLSIDEMHESGAERFHRQMVDGGRNPEQSYVERERNRILHSAIGKLRPRIRKVLEIRHLHELSLKDTAKILDISVAAAKGRFFHGRAALRRSMALRAVVRGRSETAA
ncbi:MAG TPA: sigma-70 family RNA polymerase sigma factor [Verrucomicrobiae bacterium]|nr:sigma-70 family RNA polymerase sigma factor [Verrucomicrobiae bacterium]